LGGLVASIWKAMAAETPGIVSDDFVVQPDRFQALLYAPGEIGALAVGGIVARFKNLVAATAERVGLPLEPTFWENGFVGRLIVDPVDLTSCRANLRRDRVPMPRC
jgi:hypothetical protein